MILNGKGGLIGCGLHGHSLDSVVFFNMQSNNSGLFSIKHFCLCQVFLFVCLVVSVHHSWAVEERRTIQVLDGWRRVSYTLKFFLNFLLLAVHYTCQYMLCAVAIVDCTHNRVSYSFLQGLGNFPQENTTSDILIENKLQPPLVMVTIDQEGELLKPNSWTKCKVWIVNRSRFSTVLVTIVLFFLLLLQWIKK